MRQQADRQQFRNEDLTLKVSEAVDRKHWDENRYEAFIDELCHDREYQKEALRTALRYLCGGRYANLRALARENYKTNEILGDCYGSWDALQRQLQLPDQLAASLDLATGTGKSYVLYGLAAIMLAEGLVDSVLVLCPSTTIEAGLLSKFRELASNSTLQDLLPAAATITAPDIINASESIITGSLCVENYHAVLEHVRSSIRDSLTGKGDRLLILNDETHHVVNESGKTPSKWKEFLSNPDYGFHYILGVSGTCYLENSYFTNVIYRYSLRQAMEERYVKDVHYLADLPRTGAENEKWQLRHNKHEEIKQKLQKRNILPLTIIVTPTISRCKDVAEELRDFLIETEGISPETAIERVLCIFNNAPDVVKLPSVDLPGSKVEWIISVSMLSEGWDVKRVFQIVPHEERAFNSKLLIAQVLGRGLRIPPGFESGTHPQVVIFNHEAWAPRIDKLVNEVLDREKRLSSYVIASSVFHFDLHNIKYKLDETSVKKPMTRPYNLLEKGFVDLAGDVDAESVSATFVQAGTCQEYKWQTTVKHKTYTIKEIAQAMYDRLWEADNPDEPNTNVTQLYTEQLPIEKLEEIIQKSLELRKMPWPQNKHANASFKRWEH